jgi:hypothetical protein
VKTYTIALSLSLLLGAALAPGAMAQSTPQPTLITEQEVQAIGVDAYLYLYSLVTMDLTRKQLTNVEPGKGFDIAKLDPGVAKVLEGVPAAAQQLMAWKVPTLARVANGWSMNTDTMGVYGNYYLKRAIVTQMGLGANLPEDAIYPINLADETGRPLDGTSKYAIHFEKTALPPVDAFWSVTLYDQDGFQVANPLNRFAVSSWMPFKYNPDGSLTLYFENESPGTDKEANWLPAPKGAFNLTMRLYAPRSEALTGKR